MQYKFFEEDCIYHTQEWHEDRAAAHHMEEPMHAPRLLVVAGIVEFLIRFHNVSTIVDLGCGDGGLIHQIQNHNEAPILSIKGYDFQPMNVQAAHDRGRRNVEFLNFLEHDLEYADLYIATEVLEHLKDPWALLKRIPSRWLVASCPNGETPEGHYEAHLWGWDGDGFRALMEDSGWKVYTYSTISENVQPTQIVVAHR